MSDLKTDLVNELLMEKNYHERELVRLSNQPITITYRDVINGMLYELEQLALVDTKLNYIDKYFVEKPTEESNEKQTTDPQGVDQDTSIPEQSPRQAVQHESAQSKS